MLSNRAVIPETAKIVPVVKIVQTPEVAYLAKNIQEARGVGAHWWDIANQLGVSGPDGNPSPGLAKRIADGYEPRKPETRTRLGLPPICPECHQKLPKPARVVKFDPAQMDAVIAFLRAREKPLPRIYARGGNIAKGE